MYGFKKKNSTLENRNTRLMKKCTKFEDRTTIKVDVPKIYSQNVLVIPRMASYRIKGDEVAHIRMHMRHMEYLIESINMTEKVTESEDARLLASLTGTNKFAAMLLVL